MVKSNDSFETITNDNKNRLSSSLVIILLITQVLLSLGIVLKFNNVENKLANALISNPSSEPDVPSYISDISTGDDPSLGADNAKITIIEFSDYECPFCANAVDTVKSILEEYKGEVRLVYRDNPLVHLHPDAFQAAEAANCAGEQDKYWQMHDILFANQAKLDSASLKSYAVELNLDEEQFNNCLESGKYADEIRQDMEDASKYQVTGTPTFFVNGHRVIGHEQLRQTVESQR